MDRAGRGLNGGDMIVSEITYDDHHGHVLKVRLDALEVRFDRFDSKLDNMGSTLNRLANANTCPKPGLCMELEKTAREQAQAIRSIENAMAWAKGAAWAAGFLGGGAGAIFAFVLQRLFPS
jgi:hypothetical protein